MINLNIHKIIAETGMFIAYLIDIPLKDLPTNTIPNCNK